MFDALVILVGSLDSLPNMGRVFLSAVLLALLLGLIDRRLAPENVALGVSYRKSALLSLLIVPVLTHLVIGFRLVLLVEELPALDPTPDYWLWTLLAGWFAGVGYCSRPIFARESSGEAIEDVDAKLAARFEHWCNRLSIARGVRLVTGNVEVPRVIDSFDILIVVPRAFVHWPVAAQDLLMTRELCYVRGRTRLWHVVGASIAALFWLVPSVRAIAHGLDRSLEQTCNRLAMSCFSDRLGYDRAKKQLEQRLETQTDGQSMPVWEAAEASVGMGPRYQRRSRRKDPQYDRVFWSLVQVTVVVFILTGTTLQQLEVFDGEEVELSERWFFSYERSADYSDRKIESTRKRRW